MSKINVPFALLSLATSVLLWASVYNDKNDKPKPDQIPAPVRTSGLNESLYVITEGQDMITLPVSGYAKDIRSINRSSVTAIVDLKEPKVGESTYPVTVFPASVRELLSNNALTVKFKIDKLVTKKVDVAPRQTGNLMPGVHLDGPIDTFPRKIYVTGPSESIAKIISVQVFVNLGTINQSPQELELDPRPVDESGRTVMNIMMSATEEHVPYVYNSVENTLKVSTTVKFVADAKVAPKPPKK